MANKTDKGKDKESFESRRKRSWVFSVVIIVLVAAYLVYTFVFSKMLGKESSVIFVFMAIAAVTAAVVIRKAVKKRYRTVTERDPNADKIDDREPNTDLTDED